MVVVVVEESHKKIRGGGEREGKMREKKSHKKGNDQIKLTRKKTDFEEVQRRGRGEGRKARGGGGEVKLSCQAAAELSAHGEKRGGSADLVEDG